MNYKQLIRAVFLRLSGLKYIILIIGLLFSAITFFYCKKLPTVYTSRATVFPLNASNDNANAASALTSMLGLSETPKSFIQEASINIVDLAQSRNTREAVALERLPEMGNKTIAELMINEYNKNKPFYKQKIIVSSSIQTLAATGGNLLNEGFFAKINKNGILEINCSATDVKLVGPISNVFVDKISGFYKELKIRKAKLDYDFMTLKVDSLETVLASFDSKAIGMSNTTMFVAPDKLQFQLPKENLGTNKSRVMRQRDLATDNREEALWRLQKVTPIIAILDKPDPPYDAQKPSSVIYAAIGFFLGITLSVLLLSIGLIYSYIKAETKLAVFGTDNKI